MVSIDRQIKQQGSPRGLGANPGLLIDSYEMKGKDGYIVYDDAYDTRAEVGFVGGEAIRADGPGKKIMETNWLSAGTIRDNMIMFLSYETSTVGSAPPFGSSVMILEGKIYKRNPKTKEVEKSIDIGYVSNVTAQKNPGTPNLQSHVNSFATRFLNFTPQHEYKFELSTSSKLEEGQSVIIDYLYLEYVANQSWMEPKQRAFAGTSASDVGGVPGIPLMEGFSMAVSTNSNGDGSATATQYTEQSYKTSFEQYNRFHGTYNSSWAALFTPRNTGGPDSYSVTTSNSTHPAGGLDYNLTVDTTIGAGTLYGWALLMGHKSADQI